jgi:hypothetical protein
LIPEQRGGSKSRNKKINLGVKQKGFNFYTWVKIPEWWVKGKQNGGSKECGISNE